MSKLKVRRFTVSLDGFGACPNQTLEKPMGSCSALMSPALTALAVDVLGHCQNASGHSSIHRYCYATNGAKAVFV